MEEIEYKIDVWKHILYDAMTSNKVISAGDVLKISQKLDKFIVESYKKQLNINNE